jgi:hypothetical protein
VRFFVAFGARRGKGFKLYKRIDKKEGLAIVSLGGNYRQPALPRG